MLYRVAASNDGCPEKSGIEMVMKLVKIALWKRICNHCKENGSEVIHSGCRELYDCLEVLRGLS